MWICCNGFNEMADLLPWRTSSVVGKVDVIANWPSCTSAVYRANLALHTRQILTSVALGRRDD